MEAISSEFRVALPWESLYADSLVVIAETEHDLIERLNEWNDNMVNRGMRVVTHTQPFYGSLDFVWDNPGEPVPEETFTHSHCGYQLFLSASSIYYDPWHPMCSIYVPDSLFPQCLLCFFGLPLGLAPSTSYSIHFFTNESKHE